MEWNEKIIKDDIKHAKSAKSKIMLVEADAERGIEYSCFLYIPEDSDSTIVMDCLNYSEPELENGEVENHQAVEQVYSWFEEITKKGALKKVLPEGKQEDYEKTMHRMMQRMGRAMNSIANGFNKFPNAPIMIPIIPEYDGTVREYLPQELNGGILPILGPKVNNMIKDAQNIVSKETGRSVNDKVFIFGHSQSAVFGAHYSMAYPEMVEGIELTGSSVFALPLEGIKLKVIDGVKPKQDFEIIDKAVVKEVTKEELQEILADYEKEKKEYHRDITLNEDGTYTLPLNFPMGFADIEHVAQIENFPNGKKQFMMDYARIPRMHAVGEREEQKEGHFAYFDGKTLKGTEYKAGDDVDKIEPGSSLYEIERLSMHNRTMEYVATSRILFGRSENEKWNTYLNLLNKLGMNVQGKIYSGVNHEEMHGSDELKKDSAAFYEGVLKKDIPTLGNAGRAKEIRPIDQLKRRFLVSGSKDEYDKKQKYIESVDDGILMQSVEEHLRENSKGQDRYKSLDGLTYKDVYYCFVKRVKEIQMRKEKAKEESTHVD